MNVYVSFEEQKKQDANLNIKAMATQFGINLGVSLAAILVFSFLRPRNTLVYAPKYKFSTARRRPPAIGSGWLAWVKPVFKADDQYLMDRIGFDAVLFIRFIRLLRRLLLIMSIIGVCALIPINIVATYRTGDWPPPAGTDVLSISGINYNSSKPEDLRWYWAPATATWIYTIFIAYFLYRASCDYIDMRQQFFRDPPNQVSAKSLLISNIPKEARSDSKLKSWVASMKGVIQYPIEQAIIGHHNAKLNKLTVEHEEAVRNLENTLASYLEDGKASGKSKKRPTIKVGGFLGCGGRKQDAIDYYTKQVKDLAKEIKELRSKSTKPANYGWISFSRIEYAHTAEQALLTYIKKNKKSQHFAVRLSPQPSDLIWPNLPLEEKTHKAKIWIGRLVYWVVIFSWMIPVGALSATSNILNLIRLIPNSEDFINNNSFLVGIIQAWFTPIVMAIFFFVLPYLFRFISQQQGYQTQTTLDHKVFTKLYIFFIINNLLVFTLTSILIGIFGQIKSLITSGKLDASNSISDNITQLAKNLSDVSTFWINYTCIKALGITMDLAQVLPLVTISLHKWITRPSPRQLREMAQPPEFDYPSHYGLLLFFFTIGLLYSAIAPFVLPFTLLYFCVATIVYKYMLMYIFVTKIESGGRMWPVLYHTILVSTILFQLFMIIILNLKGGHVQSFMLIPLPVLTIAFEYLYYKRMETLGSYLSDTWDSSKAAAIPVSEYDKKLDLDEKVLGDDHEKHGNKKKTKKDDLSEQFKDPALHKKLLTPMVSDSVKHLLPQVYRHDNTHTEQHHAHNNFEMIQSIGKKLDLHEENGFYADKRHPHRLTMMDNGGVELDFCTVTEREAIEQVGTSDEENSDNEDDDLDDVLRRPSYVHSEEDAQSRRGLVSSNRLDLQWRQQQLQEKTEVEEEEEIEEEGHYPASNTRDTGLAVSEFLDLYDHAMQTRSSFATQSRRSWNVFEEPPSDNVETMWHLFVQSRRKSYPECTARATRLEIRGSMPDLIQHVRSAEQQESEEQEERRRSAPGWMYVREKDYVEATESQRRNSLPPRLVPIRWQDGCMHSETVSEQHAIQRSLTISYYPRSSRHLMPETASYHLHPSMRRSRTLPLRASIASSSTGQNSRYRITYYDDLLEELELPLLPHNSQAQQSFHMNPDSNEYSHNINDNSTL